MIAPDLKWDQENMSQLYLQAVVHNRSLRSLRDLRAEHVPMLKDIIKQAEKLAEEYGLERGTVRCWVHYQPVSRRRTNSKTTDIIYATELLPPSRPHHAHRLRIQLAKYIIRRHHRQLGELFRSRASWWTCLLPEEDSCLRIGS